jgi:hypothetical protein
VGGSLYLSGTGITALPDNLTVGGSLYLSGTGITASNVRRLKDGDYAPRRYLYADGILTHVKSKRVVGGYTYYVGKIKGHDVISDGKHFAHCKTVKDGIADLLFKAATERGADQYRNLNLDSTVSRDEAITMYRIITGACRQGTEGFVSGLRELKDSYTVQEMIDITKGQYGASNFAKFFEK